MATQAQIDANRQNAKKSTGPKSQPGKDKTRFNGLKHGLRSNQVVLPGESAAEFNAELKGWADDWRPGTHTRAVLVERAAVASWRLRRCVRAESDLLMSMAIRAAKKRRRGVASTDDPDRRADRAFERMYREPAESVAELRSFVEGVDRLIARWGELDDVLAEDAQNWYSSDHHDTLMNLLGLDGDDDDGPRAEGGPMVEDSRRLLASNNAQLIADQLPVAEADATGDRLRAGIAREVEALESLASELADDDDRPAVVDATPDEEIKFLGVNKQIMLLHRYEMAHERSLRAAIKDLVALEKSGADLGGRSEVIEAKQVVSTAPAVAGPGLAPVSAAPTEANLPGRPATPTRAKRGPKGHARAVEAAEGAVSPPSHS